MGGELYDKIVQQGKPSENESGHYFQQLVDDVAHCHRKGVFHRDLKPEVLLLDAYGNLKVSDFGLSALSKQVLSNLGYDGAAADVWSCGVILYVLMVGYLPFEEAALPTLGAEFTCPFWISAGVKTVIHKILDPNPKTRNRIEEIRKDPWFTRNYVPVKLKETEEVNLDDVWAVFDEIEIRLEGVSANNAGQFAVVLEVFEVAPSLFMIDVRKAAGGYS